MAYKYESQYDSPNFTPASQVPATWGRQRTIEAIAIHWWGDPNTGPTYEGVISTLCNPARQASAHFVATGTGRRVACLVDPADASWATNSANPYTISIECDPRCRDEDYDVVGELIAELRATYGNLPLVPHRQFSATACPGNYDFSRLERVAASKVARAEDQFGMAKDKVVTPPTPAPAITSKSVNSPVKRYVFNKNARLYNVLTNAVSGDKTYPQGESIDIKDTVTVNTGWTYLRTTYSSDKDLPTGFRTDDVTLYVPPVVTPPVTPVDPPVTPPKPVGDGFTENDRTVLNDIKKLLESLLEAFKRIFKQG